MVPGYLKLSLQLIRPSLSKRRKFSTLKTSRLLRMTQGKAHGVLRMVWEPSHENWPVPSGGSCKSRHDEVNASKHILVPYKFASWAQKAC